MESSKRSSRFEFWQDVLKQFVDSKLSVIDFCSQKGLSFPSFYQWKRKLLPVDKSPPVSAMVPVRIIPSNATQPEQDQEADQPQDPASPDEPSKKGNGRRPLPSNWPKEIRRHELSEEVRKCPCCGEVRCEMGVETSQQIEFIPAVFKIIEHQRVQYACKSCQESVAIAPKPPQPIEKGLQVQGYAPTSSCRSSATIFLSIAKKTCLVAWVG